MKEDTSADRLFRERSPQVVAMDNLIRRKLRVSDPSDPEEIVAALGKLYVVEKESLDREALGISTTNYTLPAKAIASASSSGKEVEQAVGDVERDLNTLTTNSLLKDIEPELNGWASAIRAAVADGINASRQALDPRQRDLAFSKRRLIGDYARIVRYVGALTPNLNIYYRRLAQSLDETASVMLVLMGENLANIGFGGSRFLLQVTQSDLQERRDSVLLALRNLTGSVSDAFVSDKWPRGLVAYRQFLERLERDGETDLRALFQENAMARVMDDLIHRTAGGTSQGMRETGATFAIAMESMSRLISFGHRLVDPEAPQLATFLSALQMFLDAFTGSESGYRLLYIARPPILYYGLYGLSEDTACEKLNRLVTLRNQLARYADCYLNECSSHGVKGQLLIDKVLYDVDRAIDLYLLGGKKTNGVDWAVFIAGCYGYLIKKLQANNSDEFDQEDSDIKKILDEVKKNLLWPKLSWGKAKMSLSGDSIKIEIDEQSDGDLDSLFGDSGSFTRQWNKLGTHDVDLESDVTIPADFYRVYLIRQRMIQELCLQRQSEEKWRALLETMSPSCISITDGSPKHLVDDTIRELGGDPQECVNLIVSIPPTPDTSFAAFSYGRYSEGKV